MWKSQIETIKSNCIIKIKLFGDRQQLTYLKVIELWQSNSDFNFFFNSLLAKSPFAAYFWETPPVTSSTVDRGFEFVLVNNERLEKVSPNPNPFQKYFDSAGNREAIAFPNLGNDATLIVPCPCNEHSTYTHIADFVRKASQSQQQALWQTLGEAMQQNLNEQPIWLNTSGLGVHWLHIRLDSSPKYYNYQPYK